MQARGALPGRHAADTRLARGRHGGADDASRRGSANRAERAGRYGRSNTGGTRISPVHDLLAIERTVLARWERTDMIRPAAAGQDHGRDTRLDLLERAAGRGRAARPARRTWPGRQRQLPAAEGDAGLRRQRPDRPRTVTGWPSRWRSSGNSGCQGRATSTATAWTGSRPAAANPPRGTPPRSPSCEPGWAAGTATSPLATMDPGYIESVWRSLRRVFDAGLLDRGYRITRTARAARPRCPGTTSLIQVPGQRPTAQR